MAAELDIIPQQLCTTKMALFFTISVLSSYQQRDTRAMQKLQFCSIVEKDWMVLSQVLLENPSSPMSWAQGQQWGDDLSDYVKPLLI